MDIFYEQFLSKDYSKQQRNIKSTKIVLILLILLNVFLHNLILIITFSMFYVVVLLIARKKLIEFEYELIGRELIISKIIDKSSRKKLVEINIDNVLEIISTDKIHRENVRIINASLDNLDKNNLSEKIILIKKESNLIGYKVALDKKLENILKSINSNIIK